MLFIQNLINFSNFELIPPKEVINTETECVDETAVIKYR